MEDSTDRRRMPISKPSTGAHAIATGKSGHWLRAVSRFGLISRGLVYLLVGYLSLRIALDAGGRNQQPASAAGAVQVISQLSWGSVLLAVLAAGFAGYALTQLVEAIYRPRYATSPLHRWRQRMISTIGFLLYTAFCVSTISLLGTIQRADGTAASERRQDTALTADALRTGPGRVLLGVIGAAVVLAGVELGRRSIQLTFQERFVERLHPKLIGTAVRTLGALGCLARAAVFVLVGVFVVKAAISGNPWETRGLDATFRGVVHSTYGPMTLGALAAGLACYGLYCLVEARYRDLTPGR